MTRPRVRSWWTGLRSSLWFLPTLIILSAVGLATLTVWLDQRGQVTPGGRQFILVVGAEGARGVLGTIAGSIITVTGVVFSITIVVLQLASSQFSPRVLRSFTADRSTQLVLGVFIGTFTYALLVLRTVRSEFSDYTRFVPALSVNVAVLLALVSMGFLIYFIDHIARSIQAETIIARVTGDALEVVDRLFPEPLGAPAEVDEAAYLEAAPIAVVYANASGYLQSVDPDSIMRHAVNYDLVLRLERRIGSFVVAGDALISIIGGNPVDLPFDSLRNTVTLGAERTPEQDVERGLIELTDIAVRALSPGINDPTTATVCIDRLTEIFMTLGCRAFPPVTRRAKDGVVRVIAPRAEFEDLVSRAYGQIRVYAASNPAVLSAIEMSLQRLLARLPARRQPPILAEIERTHRTRPEVRA